MAKNNITSAEQILIGKSRQIVNLRKAAEKLKYSRNILVTGERGAGKTAVAHALHHASTSAGPIKIVYPMAGDEAEVNTLGDAVKSGTLIVREVEEYLFLHQALIAKFIEDQKGKRGVRIILTAKEPLSELGSKEKMNKRLIDLVQDFDTIKVPPLAEHPEDIAPLVAHFTKKTCEAMGIAVKALDINVLDLLSKRDWPGNVRELKSVVEQAVLSATGETIELPASILDERLQLDEIMKRIGERKKFAFDDALENLEKSLIERTLEAMNYNQTRSAGVLGISGANFRYRLRKYRIRRKGV